MRQKDGTSVRCMNERRHKGKKHVQGMCVERWQRTWKRRNIISKYEKLSKTRSMRKAKV